MSNNTTIISDLIDIRIEPTVISRFKEWQQVRCEIIKEKTWQKLKFLFNDKNKVETSIAEEYHIVSETYVEYESLEHKDENIIAFISKEQNWKTLQTNFERFQIPSALKFLN